jgi:pyruvate kinase
MRSPGRSRTLLTGPTSGGTMGLESSGDIDPFLRGETVSNRSTKIVATLGPATSSSERIAALIESGMDVARLNFSHGTHEEHAERIAGVRRAARDAGRAVAILQDLQGPKIRTGPLKGGGPLRLEAGREFRILAGDEEGDETSVSTTYEDLPKDVAEGARILISDGLIELEVTRTHRKEIETRVVRGGELKERQGIHVPGVSLGPPTLDQKDVGDLDFGLEHGVDYVGISFVRRADDVRALKKYIARREESTPVIAKIEKPEALENLGAILDEADGVMVARGDLGVELSPGGVPLAQKRIIHEANLRAKPVITATQMLESMIENPRPTRAEASDVANAILDGSDAVMLSGETAVGKFPVEALRTMVQIAEEVEGSLSSPAPGGPDWSRERVASSPQAIAAAVAAIVQTLENVSAVWVFTQSGNTARLVSHHRPRVPIVGFSPNEAVCRRMGLLRGVVPVLTAVARNAREFEEQVHPLALERGLAKTGDTVVITGSHPFDRAAPTNFLKIETVAHP